MFVLVVVLNHVLYRFFWMHRMLSGLPLGACRLLSEAAGTQLGWMGRAGREAGPWRPKHAESAAVLGGRGWDEHPTDQGEVATRSGRLGAGSPG